MQSPSPPLLPLLRSALQGEILALILLNPGQEWSLTDLASRVGASVSTAQREVSAPRTPASSPRAGSGTPGWSVRCRRPSPNR